MSTRKPTPNKHHKATKAQQRARAQRRQARRDEAEATARARRRQRLRIGVIVLSVLVVIAAIIALAIRGSGDEAESSSATAAAAELPENCTPPPATPGAPPQLDLPDAGTAAGLTYEAVITTNCGDLIVELDGERAPQAVASFLALAEQEFYLDSPCHRLLNSSNVVLQCGDPTGTGSGGPGYGYGVEYVPADGRYPRGTLAMARTSDAEQGTGSQFFVVARDSTWPPEGGGYTIFGNVTSGMDVIDQVVAAGVVDTGVDGPPALPLSILTIAVTEKKV